MTMIIDGTAGATFPSGGLQANAFTGGALLNIQYFTTVGIVIVYEYA